MSGRGQADRRWRRARIVVCVCLAASVTACLQGRAGADESMTPVMREFAAAWQRADPAALASLFSPYASLVVPDGQLIEGRPAIEAFYRAALTSGYGGSRVESTIQRTYRFRRDIAIVDGAWHIGDIHGGRGPSDERGIFCAILIRVGPRWSIAALREQAGANALRPVGP